MDDRRSELPTSAHLRYFLSTFYANDTSGAAAHWAWTSSLPTSAAKEGAFAVPDPSYVRTPPTLVILHNPSEYLAESQAQT